MNGIGSKKIIFVTCSKGEYSVVIAYGHAYVNISDELNYFEVNNPFKQNRVSGYLNLANGNGTLTLEIKNIQYNESRIYIFEMFETEELGVYVEVQGKKVPYLISFYKSLKEAFFSK